MKWTVDCERKGLGNHVFYGCLRSRKSREPRLDVGKKNEGIECQVPPVKFSSLELNLILYLFCMTDTQAPINPISPFSTCSPDTESPAVRGCTCLSIGNSPSLSQ